MSDLDRVVDFLRAHIKEANIMDFLERPSPKWDDKCILDMVNEGKTEEVLDALAEAMDS